MYCYSEADSWLPILIYELKRVPCSLRLKNIKSEDDIGADNQSIKGRMELLIAGAAVDIQQCGNACDAYMKTRVLTRVIKGPIWDATLVGFVGCFKKRKKDFVYALSIHTGLAVDRANGKLDNLQETTEEIKQRLVFPPPLFQETSSSCKWLNGSFICLV